jgi:hypothetical protein
MSQARAFRRQRAHQLVELAYADMARSPRRALQSGRDDAAVRGALAPVRAPRSANSAALRSSSTSKCGRDAGLERERFSSDWQKAWMVLGLIRGGVSSTRAKRRRARAGDPRSVLTLRQRGAARVCARIRLRRHSAAVRPMRYAISEAAALVESEQRMRAGGAFRSAAGLSTRS